MVSVEPPDRLAARNPHPELRPPGSTADVDRVTVRGPQRVLWLALTAVGVLVLVVVFVLPQLVSSPPAPRAVNQSATTSPPESATSAGLDTAQRSAEQSLQAYLHLRARLELANAPSWGEPEWSAAARAASDGDRLFAQRRFAPAADSYKNALQKLESLDSGRNTRLAGALEAGERALQRNDSPEAQVQFEQALAIAPQNEQAQAGLQRARVRTELLVQMAAGEQAEAVDDLPDARAAYEEAARLDAGYEPALAALQRVERQLAEQNFQTTMQRALAALEAGRFTESEAALAQADTLQPGTAVVRDTRQRLLRARQQVQLAALRKQASDRVQAEEWADAIELYRKALAVDARAGFAQTGLAQADERLRLHRQLDHYLDDPERVYSAQPLANAEQLLASAGLAPAREPRLAEKLAALQQLVSGARTPVTVTLRSDGLTDVVIYHIGRLGQFERRQLELRPGTYTAVGSRAGYRDVRRTIQVMPGGLPAAPIDIRCEEPV